MKNNVIYNMDCVEGMKCLPGECIDLTVTSPPYDNLRAYKGYVFDFESVAKELWRDTGRYSWKKRSATMDLKTSGSKTTFSTGAVRDDASDKPRMELLPLDLLMRVATWYTLGAQKYGGHNWRKGQSVSHCVGAILRHLTKWVMGEREEDHLSAIVFNALSIMNVEMYHADKDVNDLDVPGEIDSTERERLLNLYAVFYGHKQQDPRD